MARSNIQRKLRACLHLPAGFFVSMSLLILIGSCDTVTNQGVAKGRILPNITGTAGEVLVVMDKELLW